jgi:hypothetical protein
MIHQKLKSCDNTCRFNNTPKTVRKKRKAKAVPLHATKALGGRGGIAPKTLTIIIVIKCLKL